MNRDPEKWLGNQRSISNHLRLLRYFRTEPQRNRHHPTETINFPPSKFRSQESTTLRNPLTDECTTTLPSRHISLPPSPPSSLPTPCLVSNLWVVINFFFLFPDFPGSSRDPFKQFSIAIVSRFSEGSPEA